MPGYSNWNHPKNLTRSRDNMMSENWLTCQPKRDCISAAKRNTLELHATIRSSLRRGLMVKLRSCEYILKLGLTYATVVLETKIKDRVAEKDRSTLTASLGTLLGMVSLKKKIIVEASVASYRIKDPHGFNLLEYGKSKQLIAEGDFRKSSGTMA